MGAREHRAGQTHARQVRLGQVGALEVRAGQVRVGEVGAMELRAAQDGVGQIGLHHEGARHPGAGQIRPAGRGAGEFRRQRRRLLIDGGHLALGVHADQRAVTQIRLDELGLRQDRAAQAGAAQVRAVEAGGGEVREAQVGAVQDGPVEIGPAQPRAEQLRPAEIGVGQVEAGQVEMRQVPQLEVGARAPRLPGEEGPMPADGRVQLLLGEAGARNARIVVRRGWHRWLYPGAAVPSKDSAATQKKVLIPSCFKSPPAFLARDLPCVPVVPPAIDIRPAAA
jgi:hypothetical protein